MARTPILAGNWKMHCTNAEASALAGGLVSRVGEREGRLVILAPPFTALATVGGEVAGTRIAVAAQNMHWADKGAYTGEVSPVMLRDLGVTHVILGHSERRELFGETDELIRKKVESALAHELTVILCVGESLAERDAGRTLEVVSRQVDAGLRGLGSAAGDRLILAYEPVWAIGTGRTATPEQAEIACAQVRAVLGEIGNADAASACRIQYGGSVNAANIEALAEQPDVDGVLVGGASLDAEQFTTICRVVAASHERA